MRFTAATILQLIAVVLLLEGLHDAGFTYGVSVDLIGVPVLLANASGALMWAWAEPKRRRVKRSE